MKDLVDAVIIVALVELAVGFKAFLWGYSYVEVVHNNDRTIGEPLVGDDDGKMGWLLKCWPF